jgi:lysophospholipase L1-like esterase
MAQTYCSNIFSTVTIDGEAGSKKACVTTGNRVKFGIYYVGGSSYGTAISFPYDTKMYKVGGLGEGCDGYNGCLYLPASDTLITKRYLINNIVRSLVVYKNFTSRLRLEMNGLARMYVVNTTNPDYIFESDGYAWPIGGIGISENSKWLAIEFLQRGIGLLNLDTMQMKRISTTSFSYNQGTNASVEIAVSNDGEHIALMGMNAGFMIFDVDSSCGDEATGGRMSAVLPIASPCPRSMFSPWYFMPNFYTAYYPRFDSSGGELSFYATSYTDAPREMILRAYGYSGQRLDYLALGDSYSSGEGETDDEYYLPGTNDRFEKCHVSSRSYPFLVANIQGISSSYTRSVACSGATMGDVVGISINYPGQSKRLAESGLNLNPVDIVLSKSLAEEIFLPGRVYQETFAERYKPNVVTIGIGGNDAGLMKKLASCAGRDTCIWASSARGLEQASIEIKNLFEKLVETYKQLQIDSPGSKIYAIGYPKIIDENGSCDLITGYLFDNVEKRFMNESIIYLNQVIAAAAKAAGIKYIDIQDSYGNHVLCGSESPSAMNGVRTGDDSQYGWLLSLGNESFHPNPLGHSYVASSINTAVSNMSDFDYCGNGITTCPDNSVVAPEPSSYWISDGYHDYPVQKATDFLSDRQIAADNQKQIILDDYSLEPNSSVSVEITSSPRLLGQFTASTNGSLDVAIALPTDLEYGYHTAHLYGTSYSGELIELYQIINYKERNIDKSSGQADKEPGDNVKSVNSATTKVDNNGDSVIDNVEKEAEPIGSSSVEKATVTTNQPTLSTGGNYDYVVVIVIIFIIILTAVVAKIT